MPQRCDFQYGDFIDNNYRVEQSLGEGTFGTVFKVSTRKNEACALKLLKLWCVTPDVSTGLRERFVMEFETGKIESNYLVHSYLYGETLGNPYILMEFCPNGDLRRYSETSVIDYIATGRQVLCGLRDLHSHGKVHRDLKPENVLLRADYTAVLTDFGISGDQNKRMTERGILGTPLQKFGTYPYMPPEQVNPPRGGQATVLPTTDIFSFGVMMYELIVGELPFGELNEATLVRYLENGKNGRWDREALKRHDKSGVWYPVIEGCLVPNFKERIQTTNEILKMLPVPSGGSDVARGVVSHEKTINVATNGLLLRVMQGEEYGRVYYLDQLLQGNGFLTMGRNDTYVRNAIEIREERSSYISRRHCTLERGERVGMWRIRDGQWLAGSVGGWKNSLNGTYVNSSEADMYGMPIKEGDIISIGDVKLRVEGY